jgi:flavodoxin I
MKSLVIFDSLYGNTQKIAEAIALVLKAKAVNISQTELSQLPNMDLLVVGCPVHAGHPSPLMQAWLNTVPKNSLKGISIAAFDTRMEIWIAKLFGYASPKIEKLLVSRGGQLAAGSIGFIVTEKQGPLKQGELDRATTWAKSLI